MTCAVEWKRLFSALKIFKISYIVLPFNIPFFLRNLCGKPILKILHKWDLSQDCVKQHPFYPPVFLDFYIALEAI